MSRCAFGFHMLCLAAILAMTSLPASRAQIVSPPVRILPHDAAPQPGSSTPRENRIAVWGPLFRAQVDRCWRKSAGQISQPRQAIFSLRLKRDGMVQSIRPLAATDLTADDKAFHASTFRAILRCQPYRLPDADYDGWQHFEPVFRELIR